MFLRYLIGIVLSLGFSSLCFAYTDYKDEGHPVILCVSCLQLRDGVYAGIGVGLDAYKIRQSIEAVDDEGDVDLANPNVSAKGAVGDLFLGYGRYFDWFYIAGELLYNYSGARSHFAISTYTTSFNASNSYGASILPGVRINDLALLYIRLGYLRSYFRAQESGLGLPALVTTSWGNGIHVGVGLETPLPYHLSLRAEYSYITYNAFTSDINTSFSPSNNQFLMSLMYHFDFI